MSDVRNLLQEAVGSYRPRGDERTVERRVERRHRTQRVSAAVVGLGLFALVGWLGWSVLRPVDGVPGSTPRPTVASPPGTTSPSVVTPAEPVPLGPLPLSGVAVAGPDAVELVGLDGSVLATLDGYTLAGNPGAPGVWLERSGQLYRLDVEAGALDPVSEQEDASILEEGPVPELAPPVAGEPAGRWRYVIEGGVATLGQWSDGCEVPTAFWIDGSGEALITGDADPSVAPASLALGWADEDQRGRETAMVLVFRGECGRTTGRPGIYHYFGPGLGRLIHPVSPLAVTADAWGTGLGDG